MRKIIKDVTDELKEAESKFGSFNSPRQLPTGLACRLVTDLMFETVTIGWLTLPKFS